MTFRSTCSTPARRVRSPELLGQGPRESPGVSPEQLRCSWGTVGWALPGRLLSKVARCFVEKAEPLCVRTRVETEAEGNGGPLGLNERGQNKSLGEPERH